MLNLFIINFYFVEEGIHIITHENMHFVGLNHKKVSTEPDSRHLDFITWTSTMFCEHYSK